MDFFEGQLVTEIRCLSCNAVGFNMCEAFVDLSLQFDGDNGATVSGLRGNAYCKRLISTYLLALLLN